MEYSTTFIVFIIVIALVFDFINGFHDAANSIATIVSTRVLRPQYAVLWAAFFNFIAFLFFGVQVANTIGKGVIDAGLIDPYVILAALLSAITWNLITWYYGIPSSSSHALIGALGGAGVAKAGIHALHPAGFFKIASSIISSPLLGFVLAYILMILVMVLFRRVQASKANRTFRYLQFVSASLYSLGHGGNDAQKTMGIIAILLYSTGRMPAFQVPLWIVLVCHAAMGAGTLFGGWRIVETMGMKITKLKPVGGFCAETAGAITLFLATSIGLPVSTTHTISGSIMGVGAVNKLSAVRWGVAERIVWAWILTIPASAFIAGTLWWMLDSWVK